MIEKAPQTFKHSKSQSRIPHMELKDLTNQEFSSNKHVDSRILKIKTDDSLHFANI